MNAVERCFEELAEQQRCALMPFFTAGYPDMPTFERLLLQARDSGADIIEIGFPFSDPLADGPAIQLASQRALEQGVSTAQVLERVGAVSPQLGLPLAAMSYINPLLAYGAKNFARDAKAAGFSAVILPDLPLGSEPAVEDALRAEGLALVPLVAPTTTPMRLVRLARLGAGFTYLVSVTGVTGVRDALPSGLRELARRVAHAIPLPLCVGFGISTPALAAEAATFADGVIVGSALTERIARALNSEAALDSVGALLTEMRLAVDEARAKVVSLEGARP